MYVMPIVYSATGLAWTRSMVSDSILPPPPVSGPFIESAHQSFQMLMLIGDLS